MQLIKNNPYRTVGLLVGATAREKEKQIRRLKQFIEAEQEPQEDFSFPTLGKLNRTLDNVSDSASKLNLDSDKINAALFWFYNGSHTDEPAFDALKEGNLSEASRIWGTKTSERDVAEYNLSAFNNISTLMLHTAFNGVTISETILEKGVRYKLKFLESDFVKDFKALATDETFKITKKELQLLFLNSVQSEIEKHGGITSNKFLEILNEQEFSAKEDFLKGFVQKPIEQLEKKIEEAKTKRKANKANGLTVGKVLYDQTSESLSQLKSILGISNLKFSSISDKVSDEILQCGIEYFSHYRDSSTDPGNDALDLFRKAKTLAIGNIAKQRCQENTENLQEWITDKPERDKQKRIEADLSSLVEIFQNFESRSDTIENAKSLVNQSKSRLNNIKAVLGSSDHLYLKLSTRVAAMAQHNIVEEVNEAQANIERKIAIDRYGTINKLKSTLSNAWAAITLIGTLDMEYDFKTNRYNSNKESLRRMLSIRRKHFKL